MNLVMALMAAQQAKQGNPDYAQRMFGIAPPSQGAGPTPRVYGTPTPLNPLLENIFGSRLRNGSLGTVPQTPTNGAGLPSAPTMTPGMLAATNWNSSMGGLGATGNKVPGGKVGGILANPGGTFFKNGPVNKFFGSVFGSNNRAYLGDIQAALKLGRPISDQSWQMAGYGPGGAAL